MPDPTKDLADIVEPVIPLAATPSNDWLLLTGAALAGIAIVAGLYWHWRRRAPLRTLRRLRGRTDIQGAAGELAALLPQFRRAPEPLWLDELQRLRFGAPQQDAQAMFDELCQQALLSLTPRIARIKGRREAGVREIGASNRH
ncbi:MAG: hypothetical protein HXY26_10670 [Hydrogenophilaceae bacterium]|nr:hypothetical protein [Hydrogenophilaceae bacterium]